MAKKQSGKTSKTKLANKSVNKRLKGKRKHKLENRPSVQKEVNLPASAKKKQKENNNTPKKQRSGECKTEAEDVLPVECDDVDIKEEVENLDEDLADFLSEHGGNLSFLSRSLDSDQTPKKKRRKLDVEEVEEYEKDARKSTSFQSEDSSRVIHLLPIKAGEGVVIPRTAERAREFPSSQVYTDVAKETAVAEEPLSMIEICARQQRHAREQKIKIAELAQSVLADSEGNIGCLKQLLELCKRGEAMSVRKLVLISLAEVFKDIIPGYRIRELSEGERTAEKVSKEVRSLRAFEEALLANYQRYLQLLDEIMTGCFKLKKKPHPANTSTEEEIARPVRQLGLVATKCLCGLLEAVPHFNYRNNIIRAIVPRVNLNGELTEVAELCASAVRTAFQRDSVGAISLEVLKQINQLAKSKGTSLQPLVLECLLSLRINSDLIKSAEARDSKRDRLEKQREQVRKMSKKERKRKKISERLDKELQEVEAVESRGKLERHQTELLNFLFVIYFRILKLAQHSPLLKPVLKGLSRFAHLINVDFFDDLMTSLKTHLHGDQLSTNELLPCIMTALKIISGQGEALNIDPRQFYSALYNVLLVVPIDSDEEQMKLLTNCLDIVLVKRRKQASLPFVLAIFKRMSTFLLQTSAENLLDIFFLVRNTLQLHKKCDYLLDSESGGSGVFRSDLEEPEHSNAQNSTLWEMNLASRHYHPHARVYASHIVLGAPSQGPGALPTALLRENCITTFDTASAEEEEGMDKYFPQFVTNNAQPKHHKKTATHGFTNLAFERTCNEILQGIAMDSDSMDIYEHTQCTL